MQFGRSIAVASHLHNFTTFSSWSQWPANSVGLALAFWWFVVVVHTAQLQTNSNIGQQNRSWIVYRHVSTN